MKSYKQWLAEAQGRSNSWKNILKDKISEDAIYEYLEIYDDVKRKMFSELISKRKQRFDLVKENEIKKIYDEHQNLGFIKSEKLLNDIIHKLVRSTAQLEVNNLLAGHESESPYETYKDDYEDEDNLLSEEEFTELVDEYVPYHKISDYGTEWAKEIILRLIVAKNDNDKIVLINHLFDIIHQRSDFAEFYVVGGKSTLLKISGSDYGVDE